MLAEAAALALAPAPRMVRQPPQDCPTVRLPAATRALHLEINEGAGVPNVSVAGEQAETTTGTLLIGKGPPLTLVVSSYDPLILRLGGNVQRIRKLVLVHPKGSGVTGLPRTRVRFVRPADCPFVYGRTIVMSGRSKLPTLRHFGLGTVLLDGTSIRSLREPRVRPPSWVRLKGFAGEMLDYYPDGVIRLWTRDVVGPVPARPLRLLPSLVGMAQLEREGAVRLGSSEEESALRMRVDAISGQPRPGLLRAAFVLRPIRVPVGLCGAHQVTFVVRRRSDLAGDLCHSDVITADGRVLAEAGSWLDKP